MCSKLIMKTTEGPRILSDSGQMIYCHFFILSAYKLLAIKSCIKKSVGSHCASFQSNNWGLTIKPLSFKSNKV